MKSESIKKLLEYSNNFYMLPMQIVAYGDGEYTTRAGCYCDKAITLTWTSDGFKLPWIKEEDRRMTCKEAKKFLDE